MKLFKETSYGNAEYIVSREDSIYAPSVDSRWLFKNRKTGEIIDLDTNFYSLKDRIKEKFDIEITNEFYEG